MIDSGGVKVYPKDIEEIACNHPEVREAAVFGIPHEQWGETPLAAVILQARSGLGRGAVRLDQRPRRGALPARRPRGDPARLPAQRRRQDPEARPAPALLGRGRHRRSSPGPGPHRSTRSGPARAPGRVSRVIGGNNRSRGRSPWPTPTSRPGRASGRYWTSSMPSSANPTRGRRTSWSTRSAISPTARAMRRASRRRPVDRREAEGARHRCRRGGRPDDHQGGPAFGLPGLARPGRASGLKVGSHFHPIRPGS
jgi:hypothetical protein